MLNIGKFILAAILSISTAPKDSSPAILDKSLPEFYAQPGAEFETLCRVANLVCGEELADTRKVAGPAEPLTLTTTTVRGVLDAIVARQHGYKWTVSGGVVNLLPMNGYGMGPNGGLLSAVAMPVGPISEDLLKICKATGNGCVNAVDEYFNVNSDKLPRVYVPPRTITIAEGETLGQVLNMLVLRQCKHLWRIKPLGKGYGIDMVVWLGPGRARLIDPRKLEKEKVERAELARRENEIAQAEHILEWVATRKRDAEESKSMQECRAEVKAFTKEQHTLEDFEKLALKYKKKNPEAELYVRERALYNVTTEEAELLAVQILEESERTKLDRSLVSQAVGKLWEAEVDRGHYYTAMSIYRHGLAKYGDGICALPCRGPMVDEKDAYIQTLLSVDNEIKTSLKGLFAAEAKGNAEEIAGYFAGDSLAQWYAQRFKNRREREFLSAVIKWKIDWLVYGEGWPRGGKIVIPDDAVHPVKVTVNEYFTDTTGKRVLGKLDCKVAKTANRWKISDVTPDDNFLNRNIPEIYALPGAEFETLCRIANLRCGEEMAASSRKTVVKETLSLTSTTIRAVLDAIVARYPEYRWTVSNGVVNLLPVYWTGMGVNGGALSAAVLPGKHGVSAGGMDAAPVAGSEWNISGDMAQICQYLGSACVAGEVRYVDFDNSNRPDKSVKSNPVKVRRGEPLWQVLNKIVAVQHKNMWRISPKDDKNYTIEAVVWPARRMPKAMRVLAPAERKARADKEAEEQRRKLEEDAKIAEAVKRNAAAEKTKAEEQKIINECQAEIELLKKKPYSVADFDKLAARYKNINRVAELYVRMEATYEVPPEEEARRCRELLAEVGDAKSPDPVLVLRLVDRLWTLDENRGDYDYALTEYSENMRKYGCPFLGDLCDSLVHEKKRYVENKRIRASAEFSKICAESSARVEVEEMLGRLFAAHKGGDEKAIASYFAKPPRVKMQEHLRNYQKFVDLFENNYTRTAIDVWSETSAHVKVNLSGVDSNGNTADLDLNFEKIEGKWQIVLVR